MLGAVVNIGNIRMLDLVKRADLLLEQQLGKTNNRVKRITQFMANGSHKFGFEAIRVTELLFCFDQFPFCLGQFRFEFGQTLVELRGLDPLRWYGWHWFGSILAFDY